MQSISNLLKREVKIKSPRAQVLSEILEELGKEEKLTKPRTRFICVKLAPLKEVRDLHYLLSICRDYRNRGGKFGRCIIGAVKVK